MRTPPQISLYLRDLDHPASPVTYVIQPRSQSKLAPEKQATQAKDKAPSAGQAGKPGGTLGGQADKPGGSALATTNGDLLLHHRRQGHAQSHQ